MRDADAVAVDGLGEVRRARPVGPGPALHQVGDRVVVGAGEHALGQPGQLEPQRVAPTPGAGAESVMPARAAGAGGPSTARPAAGRCAGAGRPSSSRAARPSRARRRRRPARRARGPAPRRRRTAWAGRSRAAACRWRRSRAGRGRRRGTRRRPARCSWARQVHQNCGNPCSSRTSGPSPASATCRPMPLAEMLRWVHGPGSRTLVASGGPSGGTVTRSAGSDRV